MKLPAFLLLVCHCLSLAARADAPPYVLATAHYILPETTSEKSGYFSLSESLDGAIHVGTAKYGHNAFLVEFDPPHGEAARGARLGERRRQERHQEIIPSRCGRG